MEEQVYIYVSRLRDRYAKGVSLSTEEIVRQYLNEVNPLPEMGRPLLHSVKSFLVVLRRGKAKEGAISMDDEQLLSMIQGVVHKYGNRFYPHNPFDEYDLGMDIYLHFKKKGFLERFNPAVCEIHYYIWMGCRNYMIDCERRSLSINSISFDEEYSTPDREIALIDNELVQMILRSQLIYDLIEVLKTEPTWGEVRETPLGDLQLSLWAIMKLYLEGYKFTEIGKIFNISRLRVKDLFQQAVSLLKDYVQSREIVLSDL